MSQSEGFQGRRSQAQGFQETVPDFELAVVSGAGVSGAGVSGSPASLKDAAAGKKGTVIVFWSGICSHCQRYDTWLNEFGQVYPDLGLLVVASRQNERREMIERLMAERGLNVPILIDTDRSVARRFSVEQTPRAFLLDAELRLLYRGAIDNFKYPRDSEYQAHLDSAIEDLLAQRPIRRAETPSFGCPIESVYYQA